jgi:hypothetical protein
VVFVYHGVFCSIVSNLFLFVLHQSMNKEVSVLLHSFLCVKIQSVLKVPIL